MDTSKTDNNRNGSLRSIRVAAAIIKRNSGERCEVFATQRGYGDYKGWWEFPGGKIEDGETPEEAVVREIKEELDTTITVDEYFTTIEYDYPEFHLSMDCFLSHVTSGKLTLNEHEDAKWLSADNIDSVEWLPADIGIIDSIKERIKD